MKKTVLLGLGAILLGALATGCKKSPEAIVKDAYQSASEGKFENIAAYVLPDSVEQFSEAELKTFAEEAGQGMSGYEYTSFTVDSVVMNPEETEARFVAKTTFKNGLSYTETGILRKTAKGNWRLMVDREESDTTDVYSETDKTKMTPELMRNLHYATIMTLAGRGLPQYQVKAAQILKDGVLVGADEERALQLLTSAAEKNYVAAYRQIAEIYYDGSKKIPADKEKAFEWYIKAAESGDAKAYGEVGYAYRDGEGTIKDFDKAKEWFEKGIAKDDAYCMRGLANMYLEDFKGFENDNAKAFDLYNKAYQSALKAKDDKQSSLAACNIGYCYDNGIGVDKDVNKGIEWFTKAAELGEKTAMYNLGQKYYWGTGVEKNYDKAFYWYGKADKAGHRKATLMLAECYEFGRGTDMNKKKAKDMYEDLWHTYEMQDAYAGLQRLW